MDRGVWWAQGVIVHEVEKESDTTEGLSLTDTQEGRQEGACLKGFPYLCLCVLAVPHDEDPP